MYIKFVIAVFVIFIVIVIIIIFSGPALPLRLIEQHHMLDMHASEFGAYSCLGFAVCLCSLDMSQCVDGAAAAALCFVT